MHIKSGDNPVISDANGRSLNIVGTTTFFVRFGVYMVEVYFYVCEKLAAEYVLGGDLCDKFFNSIKPRECIIVLYDGTKITIINKRAKCVEESFPIPENTSDSRHEGRLSYKVLVSRSITLRPKRQTTLMVSTDRVGLMAIHPNEYLYTKQNVVSMNFIV